MLELGFGAANEFNTHVGSFHLVLSFLFTALPNTTDNQRCWWEETCIESLLAKRDISLRGLEVQVVYIVAMSYRSTPHGRAVLDRRGVRTDEDFRCRFLVNQYIHFQVRVKVFFHKVPPLSYRGLKDIAKNNFPI